MVSTPGFKWRGPDLNRRPRGYEARSESCEKPLKTSAFANVLTLFAPLQLKASFSNDYQLCAFSPFTKGNRKTDPMCPQDVPEIPTLAISIRSLCLNRFSR